MRRELAERMVEIDVLRIEPRLPRREAMGHEQVLDEMLLALGLAQPQLADLAHALRRRAPVAQRLEQRDAGPDEQQQQRALAVDHEPAARDLLLVLAEEGAARDERQRAGKRRRARAGRDD